MPSPCIPHALAHSRLANSFLECFYLRYGPINCPTGRSQLLLGDDKFALRIHPSDMFVKVFATPLQFCRFQPFQFPPNGHSAREEGCYDQHDGQ